MSEETSSSGPETSTGDRLSDADFAAARERYELGTASLVDLASEYGVSRQALSKRFKNNGVTKASRAHELASAASKGAKDAASNAAAKAERFQDKRADLIEETRIQGLAALKQARLIGQKVVVEEMKKGPTGSMAAVDEDLRALGRYNKMLLDNIEGSLRILRADEHVDEDDLPNLVIEDLTNEEILEHHKLTGVLPEDATVEDMLFENADPVIAGVDE